MAGETRIEFDGVWKSFRRGAASRSLRELLSGLGFARRPELSPEGLRPDEFFSLKDVSFSVAAGECVGVIGNNGAGKSTALKCASRILRPNRGRVSVKGRLSALIEVGAGFHPDLTGRENVFLSGAILGMRRREIADRFDAIVEFSGMAEFIDTPVKRYSSGMFARLGFSVAAFMDPDVMLIDEVLSVGDIGFARKCERKIRDIVAGDTAVLFVSHNLTAVRMICSRVLVLKTGRVVFDGPPAEAIHAYHELLGGGEAGVAHPAVGSLRVRLDGGEAPSGETVTLDVEAVAARRIRELSVGFTVQDEGANTLFAVRAEELGAAPADLAPGETLRTRFRFAANLLPGTYWIGTELRGRTDCQPSSEPIILEQTPTRVQLAVTGAAEGRGAVNLFASADQDLARRPALAAAPAREEAVA